MTTTGHHVVRDKATTSPFFDAGAVQCNLRGGGRSGACGVKVYWHIVDPKEDGELGDKQGAQSMGGLDGPEA